MAFISSHFGMHVSDLAAARRFYVDLLQLPLLQETAAINMFAVRAGAVRISIFGDRLDASGQGSSHIILATDDLDAAIADLASRGVAPIRPPVEAAGFMMFVNVLDPDGNEVGIVQYLRDPLTPV